MPIKDKFFYIDICDYLAFGNDNKHAKLMLKKNRIGKKIFADVNKCLDKVGLMMHCERIVDAILIAAPKLIKNWEDKHDPEIHQTKKGNEWYFGMKVHAGFNAGSG